MNFDVRIDQLVLEGLPVAPEHGPLVRAAVEAELGRLLAAGGESAGLRGGGARPTVPAAGIHFSAHDTPAVIGARIGRAIHGGISR